MYLHIGKTTRDVQDLDEFSAIKLYRLKICVWTLCFKFSESFSETFALLGYSGFPLFFFLFYKFNFFHLLF